MLFAPGLRQWGLQQSVLGLYRGFLCWDPKELCFGSGRGSYLAEAGELRKTLPHMPNPVDSGASVFQ